MDFHGMKRKQLQSLCKKHGLPANLKNVEMVDRLSSVLKEVEKREVVGQSSPADSVEIEPESDSKDLPQRVKKVRFSPENETFIFISSDTENTVIKKPPGRRKYDKKMQNFTENSEEVKDSMKNSRVHSANARKTRAGRAAEITNRCSKPTTSSESNSCRESTRRQLRSRGVVEVKENQEDVLENNLRKRYLEKGGDCNSNGTGRLTRQSKLAMVECKLGRSARVTRSRTKTLDEVATTSESSEDVAVQVECETRNVLLLGEPPRVLARKTRNSIALSKGSETVAGSDAVRGRKSTLRSSYNEKKAAALLTDEKVNGSTEKKNTKKRSGNLAAEEGTTEYAPGFGSINCELLPRRSRRKSLMPHLTVKEFSVEKIAYSPKLQKPIREETNCDIQKPSGGAHLGGSKRNSQRSSAHVSKKMMSKAATVRQQRGSRMLSAEEVAVPGSEISRTLVETMNLNPNSSVSEIDLGKEVFDCIQGKESHIKAGGSMLDSSMYPEAQNAEEHDASESDKSLVIEHTNPNTVPSKENDVQELFPDIVEDNLNDVHSLRKDSLAKVNDLVSYELASPMNRPCECSYISFNLEGVSGSEPSIDKQETCGEVVEVGEHLASDSSNPVGGIGQNFPSEESAHEKQIEETEGNRDSDRNSEDVAEETEEKDHLDSNSAEEISFANQATELQDICSGHTPALYESRKGVNETKCQSISCSVLRGKMHLEEEESATHKADLPWEIPYGGKIDLDAAMEIKDDEMQKVQKASIATEDAADKGANEDCQIAENGDSGPTVVSSAEGNVSPKSGSSVALNDPLNAEFNILEVAGCECEPVTDSREVTDSIQVKQSRIELGAGKQLSSVDSNAQNMKEDGYDAFQSDKSPVSEQMDSKAVLSKANGRGEMLQDVSEDKSDGIHSLREDKLVKHVQADKLFSPGGCSERERFVVKQEISEINAKSVGLLAADSFDSIQGGGQNSPLLELGLREQIKNVTEDKRPETNYGDMIEESDETNSDSNSKRETDFAMEERTLPDKLLTVEEANANGEKAEEETLEASEKDAETPMDIIEKVVTKCSKNEDIAMIISTSKNGAAKEKFSGAVVPMQEEGVCKDEIPVVETEGKGNQIQNEEEMVKEENEKENTLNFCRESSDSLEDCPKEVWQTDGRSNPFSVTGSELQIKEDTGAVILIPPEDNRVDEGENTFYGAAYKLFQDKDSVSNNEDVNGYEVLNDKEMITEDGFRKGLKFGGESTDVVEVSLHEDFPAAPRNVGHVLFSSHEHVVSPKEDAHEDEKDEADREHSPDCGKADNRGVQVASSGERRWNLTDMDSNSSIFPTDMLSKLCCPDHPRRICSRCETFKEFHGTETAGEAPPSQNFTARANIMDYEILEELDSKTEIAQLNNSEDASSSKISLTVGVTVEEKTVQLTESPEMDRGNGLELGETGQMALTLCSDKNAVTSSAGPELSGTEIANAGESGESTETAAVSADSISVSNNSYSGMNIHSIEVCGADNAQNTSLSLNELITREKGDEHELPLNGVESDCQRNEEIVFAGYSSFAHKMLNIDTDTKQNPEEKEGIQILGVQMASTVAEDGENLNNGLPTCGQVAAVEQLMGDETAAQDQFRDDETAAKGSTVEEQVSLMTKSYGSPRTAGTAVETSYGVFAFTADYSLKRERDTNFSAISQVRTSTDSENRTSYSDLQLFTSQEVALFFSEGKIDAPEELFLEAEADSTEVVMGIGDKSCEKNLAALSPMYSKYEYLEIENFEAEPIFHHKKEEVLTAKDNVPTAAAEQLMCEATEGTMKEQEVDEYAMIRQHIDGESERDALTEMESASLSVNEPLAKCDWNILTNESNATSSVKSAGSLVSSDETEHQEVERKNEVFKINDIAPSESSLKKMNLRTPRKLPSAFDMMKENTLKNTKREPFDGSATAGKMSMKGRKALEELKMNQS